MFDILYQDDQIVAIDKPAGFHVHQPEIKGAGRVSRDRLCLPLLRKQIGRYVYNPHRLDVGTSGILVFALSSAMASRLGDQFTRQEIHKEYVTVVRGFVANQGLLSMPLESDATGVPTPAITGYQRLATLELPYAVGKRHVTARYSLVKVEPKTGRYHQIRRHFARVSHPVVGDAQHGDSHHNRFFRETLGIRGLLLRAHRLTFSHPATGRRVQIAADWPDPWPRVFELFSVSVSSIGPSGKFLETDVQP